MTERASGSDGTVPTIALADVHCHIFNASDLPAEKFIKIVFLKEYSTHDTTDSAHRLLNTGDENVVDWLIKLFLAILGEGGAPTATAELQVLTSDGVPAETSTDSAAAQELTIQRTAEFLRALESPVPLGVDGRSTAEHGAVQVRQALRRAGGSGGNVPADALGADSLESVARKAYFSVYDIGVYLRWFELFRQYRYVHVDHLVADHAAEGFNALALSPATIDYSKWLDEEPKSSLPDQVRVMSAIAQRKPGPRVLWYVAYDPLRYVYFKLGIDKSYNPLDLVRTAIASGSNGCLGVKLYPPMGFRASQNLNASGSYQEWIENAITTGDIGTRLDDALEQLYALCLELDAPIIAHTAHSNGAGPDYESRADPAYWIPVFKKHPQLRVCLAHFGRFDYSSAAFDHTDLPATSWESVISSYLAQSPESPIYADLAYFDAVFDTGSDKQYLVNAFRAFKTQSKVGLQHLVFGTDWIMLGNERDYPKYSRAVYDFLKTDCGFSDTEVSDIFVGNSLRFYPKAVADSVSAPSGPLAEGKD